MTIVTSSFQNFRSLDENSFAKLLSSFAILNRRDRKKYLRIQSWFGKRQSLHPLELIMAAPVILGWVWWLA